MSIPLLVGMIAAVAGLLVTMSFYSSHSVNGVVQQCTSINVAPFLFGPVAAVAGIIAAIRCRSGRNTWLELGLGFACVVMCVVDIATRAFGGSC